MPQVPSRLAALAILGLAVATIGGALVSEHVFGLVPCELCLLQRWPYYLGVPLAAATTLAPEGGTMPWRRIGLGLLALVFLASAGLGAYHAGVEWGLWPGPAGCSGGGGGPASFNDFARSLGQARAVSCTDAGWRGLGISLAGWNALVSLALAVLAAWGAAAGSRPSGYGSSSVSQYR